MSRPARGGRALVSQPSFPEITLTPQGSDLAILGTRIIDEGDELDPSLIQDDVPAAQSRTQEPRLGFRRSLLPPTIASIASSPRSRSASARRISERPSANQAINSIRPLKLEERAVILLSNAGSCVDAVLRESAGSAGEEEDGEGDDEIEEEGRIGLGMEGKWRGLQGESHLYQ